MIPDDFKLKSKYGVGLDWPLTYKELHPYYMKAELEIGVSGDANEQRELGRLLGIEETWFDEEYVYPMQKIPQSYSDLFFKNGLKNLNIAIKDENYPICITSTPQARNGIPNPSFGDYKVVSAVGNTYTGHRCQGYSSCVPICPIQAKYNAMKTLSKAISTGKVYVLMQAVAERINVDIFGKVTSITYKSYRDENRCEYTEYTVKGKIYVLAANVVENSKLLLQLPAASDKTGKYLMDHPFLLTWGLAPLNVGAFRGPGSTSGIETLRNGSFRKERSAFRIEISNLGWRWAKGSPNSLIRDVIYQNNIYGKRLRELLKEKIQHQVSLGFMLDQPADYDNSITIDERFKDKFGNYRPIINYKLSEYVIKGMVEAKKVSDSIFKRLLIKDFSIYSKNNPGYIRHENESFNFHGAGHFLGGHIMGSDTNDSVVNKYQKVWNYKNLYSVGCGSMPTSGTANPTLTLAAISFLTSENIISELEENHVW